MLIVNPNQAPTPSENILLWGRARRYYVPSFAGPLSVKSVPSGRAAWTTDEARHELGESSYLVVNDAHPYTIEIDATEPVETFCVFFARGFVEEALRAEERDEGGLLDDPARAAPASFREVLQTREGSVGRALAQLRDAVGSPRSGEAGDAEDALVALALALLAEREGTRRLHRRVKAVKLSTRDEIFRRLCVARDALEGTLDESLRLPELARISSLSPFHLHRHFRRTFGETPQAYRTRRRLERAAQALRESQKPVTEVAMDAGFASPGSFSSLFKRRFGVSPVGYRIQKEQD
ncbi:MAG: helix-turn-helix domain-containing protein [Vicinamibacteria bacterium]